MPERMCVKECARTRERERERERERDNDRPTDRWKHVQDFMATKFEFVLCNDTWYQQEHLVSSLAIYFSLLANHESRHHAMF